MNASEPSAKGRPMKFRKKPVVIEAVQFTEESAWASFLENKPVFPGTMLSASGEYHAGDKKLYRAWVSINTLEGVMRADLGDWIIRGIKGEFYPCKPDIFAATYEPVEEQAADEIANHCLDSEDLPTLRSLAQAVRRQTLEEAENAIVAYLTGKHGQSQIPDLIRAICALAEQGEKSDGRGPSPYDLSAMKPRRRR